MLYCGDGVVEKVQVRNHREHVPSARTATWAVVLASAALAAVPLAVGTAYSLVCHGTRCDPGSEYAVAVAVVLSGPIALGCAIGALAATRRARRIARATGQGRRRTLAATVLCALMGVLAGAWLVALAINLAGA